jgi:hypothetical protein
MSGKPFLLLLENCLVACFLQLDSISEIANVAIRISRTEEVRKLPRAFCATPMPAPPTLTAILLFDYITAVKSARVPL